MTMTITLTMTITITIIIIQFPKKIYLENIGQGHDVQLQKRDKTH